MKESTVEIKEGIHWVGVVDWELRDFHGFTTPRGGSYNAFLIDGPEPILVDAVKRPFADELLRKIAAITDPAGIRHILVNHIEPDHSGSLPYVLEAAPKAVIHCDDLAARGLRKYYGLTRGMEIVAGGQEKVIGGRRFRFLEVPMLHWPESMISYLPDERVLFSSDVFGQFDARSERFDYEIPPPYDAAASYYANIILPFGHNVLKVLDALEEQDIRPEYVLPDHGIVWRDHIDGILSRYREWAEGRCARNYLVVYDTMWNSTEVLADRIYQELAARATDASVKKLRIRNSPLSDLATEVMFAKCVLLGSPTILNHMFPSMAQLLSHLEALNPVGRFWTAFGSYGWGGGAVEAIEEWIRANQFALAAEPLQVELMPSRDELAACGTFVDRVLKTCRGGD